MKIKRFRFPHLIISGFILSFLLCGCFSAVKDGGTVAPTRNYAVLSAPEAGAATYVFKLSLHAKKQYSSLLFICARRPNGEAQIKVMGGFITKFLLASYKDDSFQYDFIMKGFMDARSQETFEDISRVLLGAPARFINATVNTAGEEVISFRQGKYLNKYYFKDGKNYPYKMEQIRTIVKKVFIFEDYEVFGGRLLPKKITVRDGYNIVSAELELLSAK